MYFEGRRKKQKHQGSAVGGGWEGGFGAFMIQAKVLEAQVVIPKFRGWGGKGRVGSSVVLVYTHARIPMSPLVSGSSASLLLVC